MYRKKQKQEMASAEVLQQNGHNFLHRVADLPVSKAALDQLSHLYDRAQQQKLLPVGLKAGESTFKLAGYVASPVIHKLPVESLDSLACKQLDKLEYAVPALKKEPEEIMAASSDLLNKAKAMPANTVQAVKDAGINTLNGVKNYAVETVTPTLERVDKVKSYSTEKVNVATEYGREKIDGVKATYDGVVSGQLIKGCYISVKDGVVTKYENFKAGVVHKYDGVMTGVSGLKDGVWERYEGTKTGLYNYTTDTLKPSIDRYHAAKDYSTEKVANAYNGVKTVGHTVVDTVVNNRMVVGVREGQIGKAVNSSVGRVLTFAETKLDETLPPVKGDETTEMHPASPEAGSWTRTMVLVSNLRGRLHHAGQQRMKTYTVRAEEVVTSMNNYKVTLTERMHTAYQSSHDYVSHTYCTARGRLDSSTNYITDKYGAGRDFVSGTYKTGINSITRTSDLTKHYWGNLMNGASASKERFYTTVHVLHTNSVAAKERLTETWTSGRSRVEHAYGYVSEVITFGKDYTLRVVTPLGRWLGLQKGGEMEMQEVGPTSILRPVALEE